MRVNLIGNLTKDTGVHHDLHILHAMLVNVFGGETEIRHIPHYYPHCLPAEINFFIELINPALFPYAAKNIWIPNPEWTYQTWEPYAKMVDAIWVKTHDAEAVFASWGVPTTYIGWTSIDKVQPDIKNYHKAIVPVGENLWRNPKPILQAYASIHSKAPAMFAGLPELHIVYSPAHITLPPIPETLSSKVKLHAEIMKEAEYDELLHDCGLCICMSAAEGFGHGVNEAMSAGCVTLLSPINPFRELTDNAIWVSTSKTTPHPHCLGVLEDVDVSSIAEALLMYQSSTLSWKRSVSNVNRAEYEERHAKFIARMVEILTPFKDTPEYSLDALLPPEEDLPKVSVLTVTKDRRTFIPLAKYCFLAQGYPEDKLEWVIVDDGMDQIKDLVSDLPNVKYILCDRPMTIGEKRNLAVERASHDVLVMLDDDDVYPNHSVLSRVTHMLAGPVPKECTFCTTIPCFDIHSKTSFMNVPPNRMGMADRVSEATLCFTRDFWRHRKFPEVSMAEGGAFLRGRESMCREMSPQEVIVSLTHRKTTSSRKAPAGPANGCHYGFSEELYTLISEISESI